MSSQKSAAAQKPEPEDENTQLPPAPPIEDDISEDDDELSDLKKRRRRLLLASKTPRTKAEIDKVLKPYEKFGITYIIDDRIVTITREFDARVTIPETSETYIKRCMISVDGNLRRPIQDFDYDAKWLLASSGTVSRAQNKPGAKK